MNLFRAVGRFVRGILSPLCGPSAPKRQSVVTWPDLIEWFTHNAEAKRRGSDIVAFTLLRRPGDGSSSAARKSPTAETKAAGQYDAPLVLIQGFFNQKTGQVVHSRELHTDRVDDEVAEQHNGQEMVVYQ
jgi:hypothetical protein